MPQQSSRWTPWHQTTLWRRTSRPIRALAARTRLRSFSADRQSYKYFIHRYNLTWTNERCVEIPLALAFLRDFGVGHGVEVGNVLSHYIGIHWTVVDKYEHAQGVRNVDVLDFRPPTPLDFAISISTMEHVGWDEGNPVDLTKAVRAIEHLRHQVKSSGRVFVSVPIKHNPGIESWLASGVDAEWSITFGRRGGRWVTEAPAEVWVGRFAGYAH